MTRKVNLQLRQQWRQRIQRQRKSGLSVAEFCRTEGVSSASFYTWRRKLQGESRSKSKRAASRRPAARPTPAVEPAPEPPSAGAFVELPLAPPRTSPWIEMVLPEGAVIRVPQQNLTALQTVLHALSGVRGSHSPGEARHA